MSGTNSQTRKRVFIVDDDPGVTGWVVRLLTEHDFDAWGINDPRQVLDQALQLLPDLVILDFDMPHLLGPEVATLLMQSPETRGIPIVFLSGFTQIDHHTIGISSGAVAYLDKPITKSTLIHAVRTHIRP